MTPEGVACPDYAALLRGVCLRPGDDLPRLVFADYLDERGDQAGASRGEFIRLQIDLSRWPAAGRGSREHKLAAFRAEQMLRADPEFNGGGDLVLVAQAGPDLLCGREPGHAPASLFSRGFVAGVTLTQAAFHSHAATIFATHPVTHVSLAGVTAVTPGRHYSFDRSELPGVRPGFFTNWGRVDRRIPRRTRTGAVAIRQSCSYDSMPEAFAALSWDCVCQGRELAGLPPLKRSAVPS